jgi:glycosyltransferase involved in cell wall biosynthesis
MSFSIITTVLNNEEHILSCLKSLKNQNFKKKNIEHIIIDGGSTDNTVKIIKNFQKNYKYLKLFTKKKSSIYQAINFGIKKANNHFIGLLHSDDYFRDKNALKFINKVFKNNKKVDAVYSNITFVDRNNENIIKRIYNSRQLSYQDFLRGEHPPHTSLFLKKKIYNRYSTYKVSFKIASDFEFMLRIFGVFKVKAKYLNKNLLNMRDGGTSTKSIKNILISNIEALNVLKIYNIDYRIYFIFLKILRKISQIKILN